MTKRESLLKEVDRVPDSVLDEVTDFIRFLQVRVARDSMATAVATESSLRKVRLRPVEDEAWQDL